MIDANKSSEDLTRVSAHILEEIKKLEPNHSEVIASQNVTTRVVYENKDFTLTSSQEAIQYGLRTITNGRLGFVTSNHLASDKVRSFAKEAQLIASLSPQGEHNAISNSKQGETHFSSFDENLNTATPKELLNWAEHVIAEARKDSRISIDRSEISISSSVWSIMNSNGVMRTGAQTSCDWFIMGMGKTDQEVTSFDYDGSSTWKKSNIENEIISSVGRFRDSCVSSLGAQKGKTYKGPVLFHPYAVLDLIAEAITFNCSGLSHVDGLSPWKEHVGQQVASPMIEAFESPHDTSRISGWLPFDREGTLTQKHTLLESGVLSFLAHNCFSASRARTKSTGNATGGSRSLPGVGFANFGIKASPKAKAFSDADLFKEVGSGLLFKRFSGNSDPVSGQFSGVAKNSYWIEGGKKDRPVQEVMVAGNIFDVMKSVLAVGATPHVLMGSGYAPYILVDGVSVTAG